MPAMPASSTITRLPGPIASTQSGTAVPVRRAWTSLASVSVAVDAVAEFLAQHAGRRGGRREADHGVAVRGPGVGEGAQGDGLAAAGRGERELHPRAGGGELPHHLGLVGAEPDAVGDGFQQRQVDGLGGDRRGNPSTPPPPGCVARRPGPRRTCSGGIRPPRTPTSRPRRRSCGGSSMPGGDGEQNRVQPGDRARSVTASTRKSGTAARRRHARSASARTWCSCHVARDACTVSITCLGEHGRRRPLARAPVAWPVTRRTSSSTWLCATEDLGGFGPPGAALLGLRARFVLRLPGGQRRLLGQLLPLDDRRWAAVLVLEPARQDGEFGLDVAAPRRPAAQQLVVDSDDLADLPLAVGGVAAVGEPHPDPLDEQRFQPGVVVLGGGDLVPVQGPSVQRQPSPVRRCRPCSRPRRGCAGPGRRRASRGA